MKRFLVLAVLVFVGAAGWRIGGSLSADALSMAVGVLFGVLAGIPTALLVMAGGQRPHRVSEDNREPRRTAMPPMPYLPPQPPVIVVAGPPMTQMPMGQLPMGQIGQMAGGYVASGWEPMGRPNRQFKLVGEREEWLEDW
jgi:hypothetical protein